MPVSGWHFESITFLDVHHNSPERGFRNGKDAKQITLTASLLLFGLFSPLVKLFG